MRESIEVPGTFEGVGGLVRLFEEIRRVNREIRQSSSDAPNGSCWTASQGRFQIDENNRDENCIPGVGGYFDFVVNPVRRAGVGVDEDRSPIFQRVWCRLLEKPFECGRKSIGQGKLG